MSAFLITLYVIAAAPAPQSTAEQTDITLDADSAQCVIDCVAKKKAQKAATARKGKAGGKKKAAPAAAPAPQQSDRDQRVDALEKDVSRLEHESAEHDELRAEIKKTQQDVAKNDEHVKKYWLNAREAAATDHVRQQEQLDGQKSQLQKLAEDVKDLYGMYDKYNPVGARIGLSPGVLVLNSLDGTHFTGVSLSATLTLSLRNWAEAFAEGGFIGAVSDRPVSARARGGVNVFPLSWTKVPGVKDIGLQAALAVNMLEVGERLKARSAFTMVELGPNFRFVFIERWLAFSAGLNLMGGLEFDQGHPSPAVGFAGHVAVEF